MRNLAAVLAFLVVSGCDGGSGGSSTQAPVPGILPQISLERVAGGLVNPTHINHAGDNTARIFVVEQGGSIRILDNGTVLPDPFLDISGRVLSGGERGLLSVAFPPGFAAKRYFYVNYTTLARPTPLLADGDTIIARYRLLPGNDNAADPASEEILLTVGQPFANHNGGQLAFGPDGFLYIGMGDGGSAGDPFGNAQNPGVFLGKLLRIDSESVAVPYAVPPDNPFVDNAVFRPEIWALGLRNPWRFSFDRQTGDLYIGDVGQNLIEEVDFQPAGSLGGENYGWDIMEGLNIFEDPGGRGTAGLTLPVAQYDHSLGCSVTGGMVYRGSAFPALQGIYFYADFCSGRIWGLKRQGAAWVNEVLLVPQGIPPGITTFGEDEAGNVYAGDQASGELLRIVPR